MALSGGIDSTAAALLLKEQGHDIVGCTFHTRYTKPASLRAAQALAERLSIEHHTLDLDEHFQSCIVDYFCGEYMSGRTPNPCVRCNREIKFGELLRLADTLHCDGIATGHYARIVQQPTEGGNRYFLQMAKDEAKDQTYFLWQLSQEQLSHIIFPLGDYTKAEVRDYLARKGFEELSQQGESQDICFIEDDYRSFLKEYAASHSEMNKAFVEGDYRNAEGQIVGRHQGFANYTIGQRKGLGIALGSPAFVTNIDTSRNEVFVGSYENLLRTSIVLHNIRFCGNPNQPVLARIRYRSKAVEATMEKGSHNDCTLTFATPVWAVTPGQSCVLYQDNRVVGGGIIE